MAAIAKLFKWFLYLLTRRLSFATTADLTAYRWAPNGMVAFVCGRVLEGDGGYGWHVFRAGDATTSDGGIVIDGVGGRWHRPFDAGIRHVGWFGAQGDGIADDTAAIQAAFDSATNYGCIILFPAGTYRITASLRWGPTHATAAVEGLRLQGCNARGPQNAATLLLWDGPDHTYGVNDQECCMVWAEGAFNAIQNIGFGTTKPFYCATNWGSLPTSYINGQHTVFNSNCTLNGCSFNFNNQAVIGSGVGLFIYNHSNMENMKFLDCQYDRVSPGESVAIVGGQGYTTVFERTTFVQFDSPRGYGISVYSSSAQIICTDCDFQGMEVGVAMQDRGLVTINGGQFENCKKMVWAPMGAIDDASPLIVRNVRFAPSKVGVASFGPKCFPAEDGAVIQVCDGRPIFLFGNQCYTYNDIQAYTEFHPVSPVISIGNAWQNKEPFRPVNYFYGYQRPAGGLWSTGDRYSVDETYNGATTRTALLPEHRGGYSPAQDVTISDCATSVEVTVKEGWDEPTTWGVDIQLVGMAGAPEVGTAYVTDKGGPNAPALTQTTTFKLNVSVPPGPGSSVTYRVIVTR